MSHQPSAPAGQQAGRAEAQHDPERERNGQAQGADHSEQQEGHDVPASADIGLCDGEHYQEQAHQHLERPHDTAVLVGREQDDEQDHDGQRAERRGHGERDHFRQ